jgi:hypothetical protein
LSLSAELRKQRSTLTNKGTLFEGTGIHFPSPGVVQVDGAMQVTGSLDVDSTINVDGDATFNGDTTIGGNAAITGTLSLPAGIIDNDALANPVKVGGVWQSASNFTVAVAWSDVISTDVTVPDGFTACTVQANGRITAFYNNAGTGSGVDYLYAHLYVGTATSGYYPLAVTDNGGSGTNQVFRHAIFTGLTPGDTLNFTLQASTGFNTWTSPTAPGNQATLGASISWYR